MKEVSTDKYKFYCLVCGKPLNSHDGGLNNIKKHFNWTAHHAVMDQLKKQNKLPYTPAIQLLCPFQEQIIQAEVLMSKFLLQHNLPLAFAGHLGHLFRSVFRDSKISSGYSS